MHHQSEWSRRGWEPGYHHRANRDAPREPGDNYGSGHRPFDGPGRPLPVAAYTGDSAPWLGGPGGGYAPTGEEHRPNPFQPGIEPFMDHSPHDRSGRDRSAASHDDARRSYRGRGPKNYVRSDERILDDLAMRLTDAWEVDVGDVEVACEHGDVTLTGTVPDRWMKYRIEDIAQMTSGVREIHNRIQVEHHDDRPRGPHPRLRDDDPASLARAGIPPANVVGNSGPGFVADR